MNEVSKTNPCPHCGKPDWCYSLENLSVCKRDAEPAQGWHKTTKTDSEGSYYYALEQPKKKIRPKQTRCWYYPARDGKQLIQVTRIDDGEGGKPERSQNRWNGKRWVKGYGTIERSQIPIYRFEEVRKAIADRKPIFIVEGESCADALWNLGLAATTNIGGESKWRETDTADLEGAEQIILCPDRDKPGLKHMEKIAEIFPDAEWLYAYPDSPFWEPGRIAESKGLDVADWIEDFNLTADDILKAVEPKRNFETRIDKKLDEPEELKFNSKLNKKLHQIENRIGTHLSYNEFKKRIEIDYQPICDDLNDQGGAKLFIAETLDLDIGDSDAVAILNRVAKKQPYHPVRDYLEECYSRYGNDTTILESIALRYFGASEPIHQTYVIKHLIGSVRRVFEPGCKYDSMLILKGEQGAKKSTWLRTLYGDENFTDSVLGTEEKDSLMALSQYWACEYSEFETITTKKDVSQLKSWLARNRDDYRAPYAKTVKPHPRTFVLVGSTNRDDFLKDETGSRRFMIIPVDKDIAIEQLVEERDRIWGAAVSLYRAGVSSYLSNVEMKLQKIINEDYTQVDPWSDVIAAYLVNESREFIPNCQLLEKAIGLDTDQMDNQASKRVSAIMTQLGWRRKRQRVNGILQYGFVPAPTDDCQIADDLVQAVERTQQEVELFVPDVPVENDLETCISWVRTTVSDHCPETAKEIKKLLKSVCDEKPELRERTWEALTIDEREIFKQLLQPELLPTEALTKPSIKWSCLPRIIECGDSDFQELRSQLKPVRSAIATSVTPETWEISGFRKGDRVRLKNRTFLKGKYHQWPTGELVNWYNIVDRISFDVELPSREIIRVDAEYLEIDTPINSVFPRFRFGARVKKANKLGTLIGKKGHSALVLWDNLLETSTCKFGDLFFVDAEADTDPSERAFGLFEKLGKGSKVRALKHHDHKGNINKIGTVRAKKYEDGKFLVVCEEEFMIFNLEAVKVIE